MTAKPFVGLLVYGLTASPEAWFEYWSISEILASELSSYFIAPPTGWRVKLGDNGRVYLQSPEPNDLLKGITT